MCVSTLRGSGPIGSLKTKKLPNSFLVRSFCLKLCMVYVHVELHLLVSLVPRPIPRFFCSSVSVDNNTRMRKGGEKRGRPGTIHHVSDVRWTQGWTGPVVVSAGLEGS